MKMSVIWVYLSRNERLTTTENDNFMLKINNIINNNNNIFNPNFIA